MIATQNKHSMYATGNTTWAGERVNVMSEWVCLGGWVTDCVCVLMWMWLTEWASESGTVSESVSELGIRSTRQTVDVQFHDWMNRERRNNWVIEWLCSWVVEELVVWALEWLSECVSKWMRESVSQSIGQFLSQSVGQSVGWFVNEWVWVSESFCLNINLPCCFCPPLYFWTANMTYHHELLNRLMVSINDRLHGILGFSNYSLCYVRCPGWIIHLLYECKI